LKHATRGPYAKVTTKTDTLGQRIRRVRIEWKWTQNQLAKAVGTNQRTVSHWEQERQKPTDAALRSLTLLFGMTPEALITGNGFYTPEPPQPVGNLLVAANIAADMIKLPPAHGTDIWLILRGKEGSRLLSPQKATALICQAHEKGQPIWIVM